MSSNPTGGIVSGGVIIPVVPPPGVLGGGGGGGGAPLTPVGFPQITYNNKTINLPYPRENTWRTYGQTPSTVNTTLTGAIETILLPRTDIGFYGRWLLHSSNTSNGVLELRRALERWWQWVQQGELWYFALESDRTVLTTLTANAAAAATSVDVADTTGISLTRAYMLVDGPYSQLVTVASVSSSSGAGAVGINETLDRPFTTGARFRDLYYFPCRRRDARQPSPFADEDLPEYRVTLTLEGMEAPS